MNSHRPALTADQKAFDKCDKLYPKLRAGRCCIPCLTAWRVRPADHIHHIVGRANPITRFMLLNLMPVCWECHQKIHAGKLTEPISEQHRTYLNQMANKSLKGICIARGITKAEYFEEQGKIIKENILL